MSDLDLTIMIPALNEEGRIEPTVDTVYRAASESGRSFEIVVVDDGSTDGTAEACKRIAARYPADQVCIIHNGVNLGLGASFRKVLAMARGEKMTWFPGDNDVAFELMRDMFNASQRADLIMTYFLNIEIRGRRRNLLSTAHGLLYMIFFDIYVQYINGPGVYSVAKLRQLTLVATRFSFSAEMYVKLLRSGVSFYELPGVMQTGKVGSDSISLRNLLEVIRTFIRLAYEVLISDRARYSRRPQRVT